MSAPDPAAAHGADAPVPPATRRRSLDADMFPDILDSIIAHADRPTRLAIRQASRWSRDRADAALCAHLALYAEGLISLTTSDGAVVPCVRAVGPAGERLPGLKWTAFDPAERARFLALLRHARVLDVEGRADLSSLGAHLTGVRTVRCRRGRGSEQHLPFACRTLESAVTLMCAPEIGRGAMRWRQPPVAEALLARSHPGPEDGVSEWRVTVHFDPEEPGLAAARIGLRAPHSVRHVRLDFRPLAGGSLRRSRDPTPEPRELGMLADAVAMAAHCIEHARFTIALDARSCDPAWVAWPRDDVAPGELTGAVYRAVRAAAEEVIGEEGVECAMRRFRFVSELEGAEVKAML